MLRKTLLMLLMMLTVLPLLASPSIRLSLRSGEASPSAGRPFYLTVVTNDVEGDFTRMQVPGAKVLYIASNAYNR